MNGKDFMRSFIFVLALMMLFSAVTFADSSPVSVEALVTVVLDDTYEIIVGGDGIVKDIILVGAVIDDSVSYEFDADGNVIEVIPPHPYADLMGSGVKMVIDSLNTSGIENFEFTVSADSDELVARITEMILVKEVIDEPVQEPEPHKTINEMAKELNVSLGKMKMLNRLASYYEDFDYEAWAEASIKDIRKEIKSNKKDISSFRDKDMECFENGTEETQLGESTKKWKKFKKYKNKKK